MAVRLRSGTVVLRDQADPTLKGYPCPYIAFVIQHRRRGPRRAPAHRRATCRPTGEQAKPYTKAELEKSSAATVFKPTGGLMTVCWIAVPLDAARPSVLTLFRGFQSPVGGADSLLDPASFDTLAELRSRFERKHEGVLHFAVTWRRAGVKDWNAGTDRGGGDDTPYVGPVWDSTRALDRDLAAVPRPGQPHRRQRRPLPAVRAPGGRPASRPRWAATSAATRSSRRRSPWTR